MRTRADGSLTSAQQRDVKAIWTAAQSVYIPQIAICKAVINALDDAVTEGYKSMGQLIRAKGLQVRRLPTNNFEQSTGNLRLNHSSGVNAKPTMIQQRMEPTGAHHDTLLSTRGLLHDSDVNKTRVHDRTVGE